MHNGIAISSSRQVIRQPRKDSGRSIARLAIHHQAEQQPGADERHRRRDGVASQQSRQDGAEQQGQTGDQIEPVAVDHHGAQVRCRRRRS
jgi:hypothetical protein